MNNISIRQSLISRILLLVLSVVGIVGVATIVVSYFITSQKSTQEALDHVEELLNTVEPSTQIACYLNDKQLASEVIKGLLSSRFIYQVSIHSSTGTVLATNRQKNTPLASETTSLSQITRPVYSPFEANLEVGKIHAQLNQQAIQSSINSALFSVVLPLLSQTLIGAVTMVFFILFMLLPRSRKLISQIQTVKADCGETISCDEKDRHSEVGILIGYINHLIRNMFHSLEAEREMRKQQEVQKRQYHSILENTRTCIFTFDRNGRLLSSNKACDECMITSGITEQNNIAEFINLLSGDNLELKTMLEAAIAGQYEIEFETQFNKTASLPSRWLQVNLTPIDKDKMQGVINDVTSLKQETQQAELSARTDPLTQLGNRLGLNDKLDYCLDRLKQGDHSLTVMMIDLDHFKQVNDELGHDTGDFVLIQVARRLTHCVRETDYLARIGGDEFVILLQDAPRDISERIAADIVKNISTPVSFDDGKSAAVGASVGIFVAEAGTVINTKELLQNADLQMYKIKRSGRNNYGFFNAMENKQPAN